MRLEMITFEQHGTRFHFRAAGACLNENHILFQTVETIRHRILPGGRVEMGEDSETALKREMREELGCEVDVGRLLWIVENFFTLDRTSYHEISLIYEFTPKDETILDLSWTLSTTDAGVGISFRWHPLEALGETSIKPGFLRDALRDPPKSTERIVVRE